MKITTDIFDKSYDHVEGIEAARAKVSDGRLKLNIERATHPIDSFGPHPRLDWKFTDASGHQHHFIGELQQWELPTLEWVIDIEGDDEQAATGHYECKICRERIVPNFYRGLERFVRWSQPHYRVNDEEISESEYTKICKALAEIQTLTNRTCQNCLHRLASGVCTILTGMIETELELEEYDAMTQGYRIIKSISPPADFYCSKHELKP